MSRDPQLRAIVGPDSVGAVVAGLVERIDAAGLAIVRVGDATLSVELEGASAGQRIQIQVLARDVIVATEPPRGLSVRNVVPARVVSVTPDVGRSVLVELDIGRTATLLARITARASAGTGLLSGQAGVGAHKGGLPARARFQRASALTTGRYSKVAAHAEHDAEGGEREAQITNVFLDAHDLLL